ncbi:HAD-IIIA family hydrolase [Haloterrigena sp. SYSU A558-1]|uniref:HAD-IIIA family hydrolase n=1 Tax=Haloterrigena gelatinilytica TaxID=2741724 RepID=A0A8J8GN20_9EURY|nr:HAD-IIIA family hydrolase [Haloterrigena gelatinilytica]NUB93049.1 HAD-IIIA family hydrolase [Haloterrigena gelatinilytica]NUC71041.1 HAD-IIIA family hydrolase [Haloterrigena gelatinilytica]
MTAEAVLFDFDNTLYPYPPCHRAGKAGALEAARERGYDVDADTFDALYRDGRREVKRELSGTAATHNRFCYFKRALERLTGEPRPGDALALGEAYWEAYVDAMELFPGVAETLATLRDRGIDVGIVTNLTTRIQLEKLEALDLADSIDLLLTSEETGREKPGSVMFTLALSRLEARPGEAVMVGDDLEADVGGANAVGLETVLFNGDVDADESLEGDREPDRRIDDFAAVLEAIE